MPHSSASGTPIAWKNSITSRGVGAAPTFTASTWSSPSLLADLREHELVGLGVLLRPARSGTSSPACSARTFLSPTPSAHSVACFFASSCSAATPASIAALSFSQMRGTAKNQVGRTSGR